MTDTTITNIKEHLSRAEIFDVSTDRYDRADAEDLYIADMQKLARDFTGSDSLVILHNGDVLVDDDDSGIDPARDLDWTEVAELVDLERILALSEITHLLRPCWEE